MFEFAFSAGMTRANWSRRTVTRATLYWPSGHQPATIGVSALQEARLMPSATGGRPRCLFSRRRIEPEAASELSVGLLDPQLAQVDATRLGGIPLNLCAFFEFAPRL